MLDLSRVYVPETYLLPQLVGGLVFGVGFALGGLCPGTSCVAAVTGRVDGVAMLLGMWSGVLATGLVFPSLQAFYESTARGAFTLPQVCAPAVWRRRVIVVIVALGGFRAAEWIEVRMAARGRGRTTPHIAAALSELVEGAGA